MVNATRKKNFVMEKRDRPGDVCAAGQSPEECEMALLRAAIVEIQDDAILKTTNLEEIRTLTSIVEKFLGDNKLMCYGGQAINNILPRHKRFYSAVTIPDYDFYSTDAMNDAIKLADLYFSLGYTDVFAKAGVHHGTYNVFVNFNKYADITQLDATIFNNLQKESIVIDGIHYAPPNWLRMAMYLELCRPKGDISRWEKVLPRLNLLNDYYPLQLENKGSSDGPRSSKSKGSSGSKLGDGPRSSKSKDDDLLHAIVLSVLLNENVVFFGGYAMQYYAEYSRKLSSGKGKGKTKLKPDLIKEFHVITTDAARVAKVMVQELNHSGYDSITFTEKGPMGEIIPHHFEFKVAGSVIGYIYQPDECVNYNQIEVYQDFWIHGQLIQDKKSTISMKIASIDTILRFYLGFMYTSSGADYKITPEVVLCACDALMNLQKHYLFTQKGILKRFSLNCNGPQPTLIDLLRKKTQKRKEFRKKKMRKVNVTEYNKWFLNYTPGSSHMTSSAGWGRGDSVPARELALAKAPPSNNVTTARTKSSAKTRSLQKTNKSGRIPARSSLAKTSATEPAKLIANSSSL
jgi:hypothetical protein